MPGEIEEADPRERRRSMIVHRAGSALCGFILLAALLGLVGKGPLSSTVAASRDGGFTVEYNRFIHYEGPVTLNVTVPAEATRDGLVHLRLGKVFVDAVELDRIDPTPDSETAGPQFFTYVIRVETNVAASIRVHFSARHFGRLAFDVRVNEASPIPVRHFAFP